MYLPIFVDNVMSFQLIKQKTLVAGIGVSAICFVKITRRAMCLQDYNVHSQAEVME